MNTRSIFGLFATIIWLIITFVFIYVYKDSISDMKLESWGNFLAGFISPVAFLWLILGYLQQQEELKLNTKALLLQQEELRKQVEETQALVKQTEAQSKATIDLALYEKQRRQEEYLKVQPLFKSTGGGLVDNRYDIDFSNLGGLARQLKINAQEGVGALIQPTDTIAKGTNGRISLTKVKDFPIQITINYLDEIGRNGVLYLNVINNGRFEQQPPIA